jgi:hypothetical protein
MGKKDDMKTQSGAMMKPEAKKPAQNDKPTQKEKVGKYKESFTKTLGTKLDTIPTETLKTIGTKIDTLIEQYTNNTSLTAEKKENFVSQLQALKEIVNEKLTPATDTLDIDSIFNVK